MPKTALVVDDSASMRQMISYVLTQAGFVVAEGADGKQGLSKLESQKFDIIITDLNMPVMDGIEFIKQLRSQPKLKYTPVLMLTTESLDSKKQAGKAAGATGWLVKPFNPQQMLQVIAKVLP
ncbi:MAG TPA: response regulator [Polyangiaceae bacterium]|nr:response regulator [Polyangiaceae bacterium]